MEPRGWLAKRRYRIFWTASRKNIDARTVANLRNSTRLRQDRLDRVAFTIGELIAQASTCLVFQPVHPRRAGRSVQHRLVSESCYRHSLLAHLQHLAFRVGGSDPFGFTLARGAARQSTQAHHIPLNPQEPIPSPHPYFPP